MNRQEPPVTTPSIVEWIAKSFDALTAPELYDIMTLRQAVFIVEQHCCYNDADGLDPFCWHLLGRTSEGELRAYLRLVPPGRRFADASLGRVVVDARFRGRGLGRALIDEGLLLAARLYTGEPVRLAAQVPVADFYATLGFVAVGEPFLEDGIPHVEMRRPPVAIATERAARDLRGETEGHCLPGGTGSTLH